MGHKQMGTSNDSFFAEAVQPAPYGFIAELIDHGGTIQTDGLQALREDLRVCTRRNKVAVVFGRFVPVAAALD